LKGVVVVLVLFLWIFGSFVWIFGYF